MNKKYFFCVKDRRDGSKLFFDSLEDFKKYMLVPGEIEISSIEDMNEYIQDTYGENFYEIKKIEY